MRFRLRAIFKHECGERHMAWRCDSEPTRAGWHHVDHFPGSWMSAEEAIDVLIHLIQVGASFEGFNLEQKQC